MKQTYHNTSVVAFFSDIGSENIVEICSDSGVLLPTKCENEQLNQLCLEVKYEIEVVHLSVVRKTFPMFMMTFGSCLSR